MVSRQGGRSFAGGPPFEVISDFATLFIDRVSDELTADHLLAVLRQLDPEVAKTLFTRPKGPPKARAAELVGQLSRAACTILPGCDEETVTAEVAKRLGTSDEGAHAWMLRPFILAIPSRAIRRLPLSILTDQAREACAKVGSAAELRRWFDNPPRHPLRGTTLFRLQYVEANRAINKGCRR